MLGKNTLLFFLLITPLISQNVQEIVEKIWTNMGGMQNYEAARQLSFTFISKTGEQIKAKRKHLWDRNSGDYVLTVFDLDSSNTYTVYFNVNTCLGETFKNGIAVSTDDNKKFLESAYQAFINDTYWLLVPAKLRDPGVHIQFERKMSEVAGRSVIHLSFDNVGLTPGDQYWLFVNDSGQIERWTFILQSDRKGDFTWEEVKDCGAGLRFATRKKSTYGSIVIELQDVQFSREINQSKFSPPIH
jgi:hypothetical protein